MRAIHLIAVVNVALIGVCALQADADEPKLKVFVTAEHTELPEGALTNYSNSRIEQIKDLKKRLDNIFDLASTREEADIVVVVDEPDRRRYGGSGTVITTLPNTTFIEDDSYTRFWCNTTLYVPGKGFKADMSDDGMLSIWNASNAVFKRIRNWYRQNEASLRQ